MWAVFGWFMILVWFPWIAFKGLPWIVSNPEVFLAINPLYAIQFLLSFPLVGSLVVLGVVVLAITGGEAKYADLGHFSQATDVPCPKVKVLCRQTPVASRHALVVSDRNAKLLVCYAGQVAYMLERGYHHAPTPFTPSLPRRAMKRSTISSIFATC